MDKQMSAFDHYDRGLVLKRVQMFPQAIDDFKKAALDPQYAGKAHVQIALCLKAAGRHEEAVMAFRQAVVAPTVSSEEQRHILYHMGQTLELLGRHEESLELYGRIKREDPGFREVAQRITRLNSGGRGPVPQSQGPWDVWMEEVKTRGRQLKPHVDAFMEQAGQWLSRKAESLRGHHLFERASAGFSGVAHRPVQPSRLSNRLSQTAARTRTAEKRRHSRAPVCLRSQFSAKDRGMSGEGVLRDLSPWGCRITSFAAVPVGESVECCIFPQDAAHPFIIDGATVRWISPREFGLSFTSVRPAVQRQIAQLCRTRAA
ncbi:PilZ domain-containing protein [Nitrospira sp. NS4]|uniref:PilZ domain-containing protein n=1 Tax=Nitrospira sp. NS4 TaxID=3414498 RepID=UPI003C2F3FBD